MMRCKHSRQKGAFLIIIGLTLAVLLGMAGLVIDLGGLFVAKTELKSAMDSCALAAAQELDGLSGALSRARSAGKSAGNSNKVNYQKASVNISDSDIIFGKTLSELIDGSTTSSDTDAHYVQCKNTKSGIEAYLIKFVNGPSSNSVGATAIATLSNAQGPCPFPIGIFPKEDTSGNEEPAPHYGYQIGEWVSTVFDKIEPGKWGWFNLNPNDPNSATELKDEVLNGYCKATIGSTLPGTPGKKMGAEDEFNSRFGIYGTGSGESCKEAEKNCPPDRSGYAYTTTNWKNAVPQNAYAGTPAIGSHSTADNFKTKREEFANLANKGNTVTQGEAITGLTLNGGYKPLLSHGIDGDQAKYGQNKRIVMIPVVSGGKIKDFMCVLLLQPISGPNTVIDIEILGNPSSVSIPGCTLNGLPGGSSGPVVPALVK